MQGDISSRSHLNLAFNLDDNLADLDTTNIRSLAQAILLRNMYSGLFEYDETGNIKSNVLDKFFWRGNSLYLLPSSKPLTSKGDLITAHDIKISLIRLMMVGTNTHGSLKQFICPRSPISNWQADCEGMKIEGNYLILTTTSAAYNKLLITLLASVDYRIVPMSALDLNSSIPKILDYQNTSGPYSLSKDSDQSRINLVSNLHYPEYSTDQYQTVTLKRVKDFSTANIAKAIMDRFIDGTTSSIPFSENEFNEAKRYKLKLNLAKTHRIRIRGVFFSKKAQVQFSARERAIAARDISKISKAMFTFPYEEDTEQFFQDFAEGTLNATQLKEVRDFRKSIKETPERLYRKITFSINKKVYQKFKHLFDPYPYLAPVHLPSPPSLLPQEDRSDAFTAFNDSAFNASLPLLSYNLNQGYWGLHDTDATTWLSNYIDETDEEQRINKINLLHFDALKNVNFYPFAANSYYVVTHDGIVPNLNPFFSSTPIWKFRKK